MKIADMHGDTIFMLRDKRKKGEWCELSKNNLHMDIEKMQKAEYLLQNFALFVNQLDCDNPYEEAMTEYEIFTEEMKKNKDKTCISMEPVFVYGEFQEFPYTQVRKLTSDEIEKYMSER